MHAGLGAFRCVGRFAERSLKRATPLPPPTIRAGGDQRYSPEVRSEAALALDLLVSLLLAPQQGPADVEGLRYVRWACRRLQGGRPPRHGPLWTVYRDALEALQRCQQGQWPPALLVGQPPLGEVQPQPLLHEPAQPQAQQAEAPQQQQQQQPAMVPAEGAAAFGAASGGDTAVQPRGGMPALQSLCVIAGEVTEDLRRRTQHEEPQWQGLAGLGGGALHTNSAAPP